MVVWESVNSEDVCYFTRNTINGGNTASPNNNICAYPDCPPPAAVSAKTTENSLSELGPYHVLYCVYLNMYRVGLVV